MPTYRYHSPLPHIGTRSSYYNGSRLCSPDAVFILSPLLLVSVRDTACMYSTSDRMHLCYRFAGEVRSEVVPVIRNKVSDTFFKDVVHGERRIVSVQGNRRKPEDDTLRTQ